MYYLRIQVLLVDGGAMVLRHVFDEKKSHPLLTACFQQNQGKIAFLHKKGLINKDQYALLTSNAPTLANFDITLLSCLLRNICGLKNSNDPVWSTLPAQNDSSIEADLVRLKNYRNEFAHINTTSALSENDFKMKWSDIEKVLMRLNSNLQNGVPNLKLELDKLKSEPLDKEADTRYQQEIKEWTDMDKAYIRNIDIIASQMEDLKIDITDIKEEIVHPLSKLTPEQRSLHESAQMFFEEEKRKMAYYIKTGVYNEASKQLQTSGIVILSGHPGEGKTCMAVCLLMEMSHESKLLRLSDPDDWRLVDHEAYTAILIDDIFGDAVVDEYKVRKWGENLVDIDLATKKKRISFVITTRHYIMQEAREKIQRKVHDMFEDKRVTMLISSTLTYQEKYKILESHLKKNKRDIQTGLLESVNIQWERVTKRSNQVLSFGFPGCAAMFASSEVLFNKGVEFFSSPIEFFYTCIRDISRNSRKDDDFMALVLVWTKTQNKVSSNEVKVSCNRNQLQALGVDFEYPFEIKSKVSKKCLERHRDEFLAFNTKTGEYSFSHSVICDVVGIVCAKENVDAVIKHASKDFIMKYITTSRSCDDSLLVYIEEYQYQALIEKLYHMIYTEADTRTGFPFVRIQDDGLENTKMMKKFVMDTSLLKHDAFENETFNKMFVAWMKGENDERLHMPLIDAFEIFKIKYCIQFKNGDMGMTLPTLLLAKKKDGMVYECLRKSCLNDNETYLSLLLAVRDKKVDLVEKLIKDIKVNDDALQIATVNGDLKMIRFLLQHRGTSVLSSHIQNGNNPLITAAKRNAVEIAECLLKGGYNANYRNQNNLSAFDKAVIRNNEEMCHLLLENGAKLNEKGGKFQRSPLHTATDMGHANIVELLLKYGADVSTSDHRNDNPCHSAAIQGNAHILKALLRNDRSLGELTLCHNVKNISKGMSFYHIAIVQDNENVLNVLKEVGINPNIKDKYGRTPLYLAVFYGKTPFVQLLMDFANPNISEKNGYTPLHAAVYKGHLKTVELLCRHPQLDVNQADKRRVTPLHLACKTANYEITEELLKVPNTDVRMKTKKGESVYDMLKTTGIGRLHNGKRNVAMFVEAIRQKDPDFVQIHK